MRTCAQKRRYIKPTGYLAQQTLTAYLQSVYTLELAQHSIRTASRAGGNHAEPAHYLLSRESSILAHAGEEKLLKKEYAMVMNEQCHADRKIFEDLLLASFMEDV